MKRQSSQRRAAVASSSEFAAARDAVRDRELGACAVCSEVGSEAHHRLPRGMGGAARDPLAHAMSRLVWLCSVCHRRAESDRSWALNVGLLVRHGVLHTDRVPVLYRGAEVLLTDTGLVVPA